MKHEFFFPKLNVLLQMGNVSNIFYTVSVITDELRLCIWWLPLTPIPEKKTSWNSKFPRNDEIKIEIEIWFNFCDIAVNFCDNGYQTYYPDLINV